MSNVPRLMINVADSNGESFRNVKVHDIVLKSSHPTQSVFMGTMGLQDAKIVLNSNNIEINSDIFLKGNIFNFSEFRVGEVRIVGNNITADTITANNVGFNDKMIGQHWTLDAATMEALYVKRTDTQRTVLSMLQNGKVGVNTMTPTANLDVVGTGNITGDFRIQGNLVVDGDLTFDAQRLVNPTPPIPNGYISNQMIAQDAIATYQLQDGGVTSVKLDATLDIQNINLMSSFLPGESNIDIGTSQQPFNDIYTNSLTIGHVSLQVDPQTGSLKFVSNDTDNVPQPFKLNQDTVATSNLTQYCVTNAKIASQAISSDKIASLSIASTHLRDSSIITSKIANNAVTSSKIGPSAVQTVHLNDYAVTTSSIADRNVTGVKIDFNTLTTNHFTNECITSAKLAPLSIAGHNIIPLSITSNLIADLTITATHLSNNCIETRHIADGAITPTKLGFNLTDYIENTIFTIPPESVTTSHLAYLSVTTEKIQNCAITLDKIGFVLDDHVNRPALDGEFITYDKLNSNVFTSMSNVGSYNSSPYITLSNGNTGVRVSTPLYPLHVDGTVYSTSNMYAANFQSISDLRIKSNLQQIENALEKLLRISGYTYNIHGKTERQAGLIAQEVQLILPEAVAQERDLLTVSYGNVLALLVEAIKELYHKTSAS